MKTTISQRELRNDSGAILRRVAAGETFTVTNDGRPVGALIPNVEAGWLVADRPAAYRLVTAQAIEALPVISASAGGSASAALAQSRGEDRRR